MPKAAVDEDCDLSFGKDEVGIAGEGTDVTPEFQAEASENFREGFFRGRVASPDSGHYFRTLLAGEYIRHIYEAAAKT